RARRLLLASLARVDGRQELVRARVVRVYLDDCLEGRPRARDVAEQVERLPELSPNLSVARVLARDLRQLFGGRARLPVCAQDERVEEARARVRGVELERAVEKLFGLANLTALKSVLLGAQLGD